MLVRSAGLAAGPIEDPGSSLVVSTVTVHPGWSLPDPRLLPNLIKLHIGAPCA